MNKKTTNRGFTYYEFKDGYGAECSLQESSAARIEMDDGSVTDGFVWLGVDKDWNGLKVGPEGNPELGARMHLSQSTAKELISLLEYFVEHGELP